MGTVESIYTTEGYKHAFSRIPRERRGFHSGAYFHRRAGAVMIAGLLIGCGIGTMIGMVLQQVRS